MRPRTYSEKEQPTKDIIALDKILTVQYFLLQVAVVARKIKGPIAHGKVGDKGKTSRSRIYAVLYVVPIGFCHEAFTCDLDTGHGR